MKKRIVIAEVLPRLLKDRGWTAKKLSELAQVKPTTISTWLLTGSRPRNIEDVAAVASVLEVSLNHLLFGEADEPNDLNTLQTTTVLEGLYKLKLERVVIPETKKKPNR